MGNTIDGCPGVARGSRRGTDAVILQVSAVQHGIVGRAELMGAGVSAGAIQRRIHAGTIRLRHRGVYQIGPVESPLARVLAAVVACGWKGFVSCTTAAALHQLGPEQTSEEPVDMLFRDRVPSRRTGIRGHRCRRLADDEVTTLNDIPVTTPARTLLDLAAAAPEVLERAFAIAERRASFTRDELQRLLARHPRHTGARAVRALLLAETPPPFTRSEAEARLLDLVRRARLPAPATNARLRGFEVDLYWKQQRLVAEVDGYAYHSSFAAFERDRSRDAALLTAGIRTIRFTWRQIEREPLRTIAQLAQALVQ